LPSTPFGVSIEKSMTLCDYQRLGSIALVFVLLFLAACMQENQVEVGRGDESLPFEPDGYYLPMSDIQSGLYALEWVRLDTVEYDLDSDDPRPIEPIGELRFRRVTDDELFTQECQTARVSVEELYLDCPGTLVPGVRIEGSFLETDGFFWEKFNNAGERALLVAQVSIRVDNGTTEVEDQRFSYTPGD